MNTTSKNDCMGFSFSKPAIYEIKVLGELESTWLARLGDMQISVVKKIGEKTITILVGRVLDQSELSGILNSLYELHLAVISVKALTNIEDEN